MDFAADKTASFYGSRGPLRSHIQDSIDTAHPSSIAKICTKPAGYVYDERHNEEKTDNDRIRRRQKTP